MPPPTTSCAIPRHSSISVIRSVSEWTQGRASGIEIFSNIYSHEQRIAWSTVEKDHDGNVTFEAGGPGDLIGISEGQEMC